MRVKISKPESIPVTKKNLKILRFEIKLKIKNESIQAAERIK